MDNIDGLTHIRNAIIAHESNAWAAKRGWTPVYTAHPGAKLLIVGQAPGLRAQTSGIPWNDPSGDNLRSWMGISRETFYDPTKIALVPMDFYYPGTKNRYDLPPRKDFAPLWHPKIIEQMPQIQLTLLIGSHAHAFYLQARRKRTLSETVRNYHVYLSKYFPLVHPSPRNNIWHKKNPWFKGEIVPVLREKVKEIIK